MITKTLEYGKDLLSEIVEGSAFFVTTNGIIKKDGNAVMGAGVAKLINQHFKVSEALATKLKEGGNKVHFLADRNYNNVNFKVCSFPTKYDWKNNSDIELIKTSCHQAMKLADELDLKVCLITPAGCGNGGLNWSDVQPIMNSILDDRFVCLVK